MRSCAVIGLPDEDKGNVVHAIVEADPASSPRTTCEVVHRGAAGALQDPPDNRVHGRGVAR